MIAGGLLSIIALHVGVFLGEWLGNAFVDFSEFIVKKIEQRKKIT